MKIRWDVALDKGGAHMIAETKQRWSKLNLARKPHSLMIVTYFTNLLTLISNNFRIFRGWHEWLLCCKLHGREHAKYLHRRSGRWHQEALEGLSTIDSDSVAVSIHPHSQDFITTSRQHWIVIFDAQQQGNLPSMLIDFGSGQPSTIATGGTVSSSSSVIRVEMISNVGGLSSSFISPPILDEGKLYMSRI